MATRPRRTLTTADVEAVAKRTVQMLKQSGAVDGSLYTPTSLAAKLAVTPRTVYTMLRNGTIRSCRVGSNVRINPKDVDAYLAEHPYKKGDRDRSLSSSVRRFVFEFSERRRPPSAC